VKIRDLGYSPSRVLFELFQNADDAYRQLGLNVDETCFRIEHVSGHPGGFRIVHWGRQINHLGSNADEGRRLGHDRDLLNMLVMNFSEKRVDEDLTGKFGLGFKSVHVLSDIQPHVYEFTASSSKGAFKATHLLRHERSHPIVLMSFGEYQQDQRRPTKHRTRLAIERPKLARV
jgi:hypothetical protein